MVEADRISPAITDRRERRKIFHPPRGEAMLPIIMLALMLALIVWLRPNAMSYFGLTLLFKLSIPLIFAALSQMLIISLGDIDLSTGSFVGFATCVIAVFLMQQPLTAIAVLLGAVLAYGVLGILIYVRQLPSIIVTLGMSFIWTGLALLVLPTPGGQAPAWLTDLARVQTPFLPYPLWLAAIVAVVADFVLMRSSWGVVLRGTGGNPRAMARAGWSVLGARFIVYSAAAVFAILSGLSLVALTTSGAPNIAPAYTLLSIAAVILGGASFTGGLISPAGAVIGAMTLFLVGSVLTFLNIPPVWQIGAQGVILVLVLLGRGLMRGRQ